MKINLHSIIYFLFLVLVFSSCGNLESDLAGFAWQLETRSGVKVSEEEALNISFMSNGIFIERKGRGEEYYEQGGWDIADNGIDVDASFRKKNGDKIEFKYRNVKVDGDVLTLTGMDGAILTYKRKR